MSKPGNFAIFLAVLTGVFSLTGTGITLGDMPSPSRLMEIATHYDDDSIINEWLSYFFEGEGRKYFDNSPATFLFVELSSRGHYDEEGDIFILKADVKNVGDYPAFLTRVWLNNVPDDWTCWPGNYKYIFYLPSGITKRAVFICEKGDTDAEISVSAEAINSPVSTSNAIPIPISWFVVLFAVASMAGIACFLRK